MVTRFDKSGWHSGIADESRLAEFISRQRNNGSSRIAQAQDHREIGGNRSALAEQAALSTLPVYKTRSGFKYIGESFDEDKTVPRNEDQAGFSFKSHYSKEDGVFASLLATEAAAPSGEELALKGFQEMAPFGAAITFSRFSQIKDSVGIGGVS